MRIVLLMLLGIQSVTCFGEAFVMDEKTEKIVKEEMDKIQAGYVKYLEQHIGPALAQGVGGDSKNPIEIPLIMENGQPMKGARLTVRQMLEPIGRSVAYAGLLCNKVGMTKDAEVDDVWVRLYSFNRSIVTTLHNVRDQLSASWLGTMSQFSDYNWKPHISQVTMQCKDLLRRQCTQGSCNSGKCGYTKSLGSACLVLCGEEYEGSIQKCSKDFYKGQVIPRAALVGVAPQELNNFSPENSFNGYKPQRDPRSYMNDQYFQASYDPYVAQWQQPGNYRLNWGQGR